MGEGFLGYIKKAVNKNINLMSGRCYDSLYRLLNRTVTAFKYQGSDSLSDWMLCLTALFEIAESDKTPGRKAKLN